MNDKTTKPVAIEFHTCDTCGRKDDDVIAYTNEIGQHIAICNGCEDAAATRYQESQRG